MGLPGHGEKPSEHRVKELHPIRHGSRERSERLKQKGAPLGVIPGWMPSALARDTPNGGSFSILQHCMELENDESSDP